MANSTLADAPSYNRAVDILTVPDVAVELRCSKAHVYKAINGMVPGVTALPAISMGRRKLVRRAALEEWKRMNEHVADNSNRTNAILIPSQKNHAADA